MKVAEIATEMLDENLFHLASDSLNLNHVHTMYVRTYMHDFCC